MRGGGTWTRGEEEEEQEEERVLGFGSFSEGTPAPSWAAGCRGRSASGCTCRMRKVAPAMRGRCAGGARVRKLLGKYLFHS